MVSDVTFHPVGPLYDLSPNRLAGVLDSSSLPVTFESSAKAWSYAVTFTRADSQWGSAQGDPIIARVTIEVLSGRVAVGVLNGDGPSYVDEVVVGVGTATVAEVLITDPSVAGDLMLRNASREGASRARISAIECLSAKVDPSAVRAPGLSSPTPAARWNRAYGSDLPTSVEKLRARLFDASTDPWIVRWSDGLSFRVLPNDQISRALFVSGTYEPNTLYVLRRFVQAGGVFLDVGANSGVFSLVAAHLVGSGGRVYSFEPSEREYRRLCDAVQLNDFEAMATPVRVAMGARAGQVTLRVASEPFSGLNTLGSRFPYDGVETSGLERVEMTTLDDFADREALARIDAIKLDVEGAEAAVLSGARRTLRRHRPVMVVELFARSLALNGASVAEVERTLTDADYRLFRIDDETAELKAVDDLTTIDEQNIVALPAERA